MSDEEKKNRISPIFLVGLAMLAGIPLTRWWMMGHGSHPFERLAQEKLEERERVMPIARVELSCPEADLRHVVGEVWGFGCGKRARYVRVDNAWHREGEVERDESSTDNCRVRWRRDEDGGASGKGADPKAAAARIIESGLIPRARVPIANFGVPGFKKLRYGEFIDAYLTVSDIQAGDIPVGCVNPEADGGYEDGTCHRSWSEVVEVDACDP